VTNDVLIFANPIAGRGRGASVARRIAARARRAGFTPRLFVEPPDRIAAENLEGARDARAAVAIGGDGTLRAVADRLLACDGNGQTPPPLLVVPFGTANLMGRHLGIRWDSERVDRQVIDVLTGGSIRAVDAARANDRLFLLMAGVGIDAQIVHLLDQMRAGPIDITSYVLPAALALQSYRFPELTIEIDGRRAFGPASGVAFIGNAAEYGTGFPILPHARTDDGLLDVCAIPCKTYRDVVQMFLYAAVGEHLQVEGVVYAKGTRIRVDSARPVPVQIDGEAAGFTPLNVDLLPVRLRFIVPKSHEQVSR
jgi:YegS/Rv2252/BmrU family lipid kinase